MFGDVPEPDLVRDIGLELVADHAVLVDHCEQVVMRRRAGGAGFGPLLVVAGGDARDAAEPVDTVPTDNDAVFGVELVSDEPVAQRRRRGPRGSD